MILERDFTIFPGDSLVWRFVSQMRLVACDSMFAHGFFAMEIQYSQLKINHLSDTPSTKALSIRREKTSDFSDFSDV